MPRRLRLPGIIASTLAVVLAIFVAVSCVRRDTTPAPRPQGSAGTTPSPIATPSATTPPGATATPSAAQSTAPPSPTRSTAVKPSPTRTGPVTPGFPASLRGKDVEVIPTSQRVVALTFDAGSNADGLPAILRALADEQVRATFFITGSFATRYPASVRAIVAGGHRLGNHSTTHPHFPALSDAAIRGELSTAQSQILGAGGTDTRPLFRFPYGDRDARTIATVNNAGYVAVRWTVDTLGWKGTSGGITVQMVVNRSVAAARPGEIVLMHLGSNPDDHSTLDAQALPAVISQLRAKGYAFTTLNALLA